MFTIIETSKLNTLITELKNTQTKVLEKDKIILDLQKRNDKLEREIDEIISSHEQ